MIERWRRHYNEERPHMSLGDLTPAPSSRAQIGRPTGGDERAPRASFSNNQWSEETGQGTRTARSDQDARGPLGASAGFGGLYPSPWSSRPTVVELTWQPAWTMGRQLRATLARPAQRRDRIAVLQWLDGWYNPHRRHSDLGHVSPINYERRQLPQSA